MTADSLRPVVDPAPSSQVRWQPSTADAGLRSRCARQRGVTAWLTGLSGAGKSTIASECERLLLESGHLAFVLDGDNLRHGLNAGLGFAADDRREAVRRAGEAALLLAEAGAVAIVGMISPYRADRDRVRARHALMGVPFLEVHVDAPLEVAERRDPKGLYAKARAGEIRGFTGIDDPYEPPAAAELVLRSAQLSPQACAELLRRQVIAACAPR